MGELITSRWVQVGAMPVLACLLAAFIRIGICLVRGSPVDRDTLTVWPDLAIAAIVVLIADVASARRLAGVRLAKGDRLVEFGDYATANMAVVVLLVVVGAALTIGCSAAQRDDPAGLGLQFAVPHAVCIAMLCLAVVMTGRFAG